MDKNARADWNAQRVRLRLQSTLETAQARLTDAALKQDWQGVWKAVAIMEKGLKFALGAEKGQP